MKCYDKVLEELAELLKSSRKLQSVSVKELAEKMNCSPSNIRNIEAMKQACSLKKLNELANALDLELSIKFIEKKQ